MAIELVRDVLYLPFKTGRKMVLTVLAEHADALGLCWPSQELIGLRASMSVRKVREHLQSLEKGGWLLITRNDGPGRVNYYELNTELISDIAKQVIERRKRARDVVTRDMEDPGFATPDFSDLTGDFQNILPDELNNTPGLRGPTEPSSNHHKETSIEPSQESSAAQAQLQTFVVSEKAKSSCINRLHDWAEFESSDKEFSSRQEKGLLTALADASSMFSEADLLLEMEVWDFLDKAGKALWAARIEESCEA
jgi:DNA-binding transcriptional ArsR family regulator